MDELLGKINEKDISYQELAELLIGFLHNNQAKHHLTEFYTKRYYVSSDNYLVVCSFLDYKLLNILLMINDRCVFINNVGIKSFFVCDQSEETKNKIIYGPYNVVFEPFELINGVDLHWVTKRSNVKRA